MDINFFFSGANRFTVFGQKSISRTITSKELTLKQILRQSMAHNLILSIFDQWKLWTLKLKGNGEQTVKYDKNMTERGWEMDGYSLRVKEE